LVPVSVAQASQSVSVEEPSEAEVEAPSLTVVALSAAEEVSRSAQVPDRT
jgi:hypothetical protein